MSIQKDKKHQTISMPTLIPLKQSIKKIVAGSNHSYAIAEGKVYCWGLVSKQILQQSSPSSFKDGEVQSVKGQMAVIAISVTEIATDCNHTFAWSDQEIYCWGSNQFYELGLEEQKQYGVEKLQVLNSAIEKGYRIIGISCGQRHSLAALETESEPNEGQDTTQEQEVYQRSGDYDDSCPIQLFGWGQSQSYQLTLNTTSIIPYPVLSPCAFRHLDQLYSRSDFNVAVCNGKVYSWGCNLFSRLGQLIPSSQLPEARIPRLIALPEKVAKIGIGTYHVVAVASSGMAYSWGKGNLGQLGIDRFQIQSKPSRMACNELIADVSCGESHTLLLLKDGRLKSCGSNVYDVLGHSLFDPKDKKKRAKKPQFVDGCEELKQIVMISTGNHHNLILTKKGIIFGWGSNDHYQVLPWTSTEKHQKQLLKGSTQHKSMQMTINIDRHYKQNKYNSQSSKAKQSKGSAVQKLQEWRHRYAEFIQRKRQQQQELMDELELITSLLMKQKPF